MLKMEEKLNNRTCNDCKLSRPSGKDNWVKCTKKHNDLKLATSPQCETPYITNGDRIRSMSDEELADKLVCQTDTTKKKLVLFIEIAEIEEQLYVETTWKSTLTGALYATKTEAIEATLAELKKEVE